jgi:hypothetical protein
MRPPRRPGPAPSSFEGRSGGMAGRGLVGRGGWGHAGSGTGPAVIQQQQQLAVMPPALWVVFAFGMMVVSYRAGVSWSVGAGMVQSAVWRGARQVAAGSKVVGWRRKCRLHAALHGVSCIRNIPAKLGSWGLVVGSVPHMDCWCRLLPAMKPSTPRGQPFGGPAPRAAVTLFICCYRLLLRLGALLHGYQQ